MKKLFTSVLIAVLSLGITASSQSEIFSKRPSAAGGATSVAQMRIQPSQKSELSSFSKGAHPKEGSAKGFRQTASSAKFPAKARTLNVPAFASPYSTQLQGLMTGANSWGYNDMPRFYTLSAASATDLKILFTPDNLEGPVTGFVCDGNWYTNYKADWGFMVITGWMCFNPDQKTESMIMGSFSPGYDLMTATYLESRGYGLFYAVDQTAGTPALLSINTAGAVQKLADLPAGTDFYGGLAVGRNNTVYGLAKNGDLYTIDLSNYSLSKVGNTGVTTTYCTALCYDSKLNMLYTTTCYDTDPSGFYAINPMNAESTLCYKFDEWVQLRILNIPGAAAAENVPSAVTDLKADFPNGSLQGTVSFLPPSTLFDGTPGDGELSWTVELDGTPVATGKTAFGGQRVEASIKVPAGGNHVFRAYVSNVSGNSPAETLSLYLGADMPMPVESATLVYTDNMLKLSWPAVKGENGGYVDQDQIVYKVTRYVNGESSQPVDVKGLSYSEPYSEPASGIEMIYYTVTSSYAGISAGATNSNRVMLGHLMPPYDNFFASASDFDNVLVIDNNHDSRSWLYDENMQAIYCRDATGVDDYAILPAMQLEKGKIYFLSFVAGTVSEWYKEKCALYVGREPEVSALTTQLIAPTEYATPMKLLPDGTHTGTPFSTQFIPEETGVYYFAIKSCSDDDQYRNFISDFQISAPRSTPAPAAVTDLSATADAEGDNVVTIKFTAPATDLNGDALTTLTSVDVYRGQELVKRTTPKPGESVTVVDNEAPEGNVTYQIIPVNQYGEGVAAEISVYVGFDVPMPTEYIQLTSGADYGEVVIDWDPVITDINGLTLEGVTYTVGWVNDKGELQVIAENLTATTYTYRVCAADAPQRFAQFAVVAEDEIGRGEATLSQLIAVGKPYTIPYNESFSFNDKDELNSILGILLMNGRGGWSSVDDTVFQDVKSQDGDGYFIAFMGYDAGDSSRLFTGRISIPADAKNPEYSFWYICADPADKNLIEVLISTGDGFESVYEQTAGQGIVGRWNRVAIDLSKYRGKDIQVALQGTLINSRSTLFDNMRVADTPAHDLATSVSAPSIAIVGKELTVTASVFNYGSQPAEGFSIELLADGRVVAQESVQTALQPSASQSVVFSYQVPPYAGETIKLQTRVIYDADQDDSNNESRAITVDVLAPDYPAVTDLKGEELDDDSVVLTWTAPDYADYDLKFTDDFENADSFANMEGGNTGGWTFYDLDALGVGGMQGLDIPGLTVGKPASFFVLDDSAEGFNRSFGAHSGHKCIAALYNQSGGQNDDWAISPELDGSAQTITFWARAYDPELLESIELLYSDGTKDPLTFKSIRTITGVATDAMREWTEYSFNVPLGAKYFAIRYRSKDCFMVMIDDVTFRPAGMEELTLIGYNIYRNGQLLNDVPVTETSYTDTEYVEDARYVVTAVYNAGQSKASNAVTMHVSGVETIHAALRVVGSAGCIIVEGTEATVTIADMSGRLIYRGGAGTIPASPGIYAVKAGNVTTKVIVK